MLLSYSAGTALVSTVILLTNGKFKMDCFIIYPFNVIVLRKDTLTYRLGSNHQPPSGQKVNRNIEACMKPVENVSLLAHLLFVPP